MTDKPSGSFVLWENTLCNPLSDSRSMAHSAWHDGHASAKAEQEQQEGHRLQQQAWTIDNKYASLLALTLECMILDPERWHDDAVRVLDDYRSEWNKLNPSPSPFGKD